METQEGRKMTAFGELDTACVTYQSDKLRPLLMLHYSLMKKAIRGNLVNVTYEPFSATQWAAINLQRHLLLLSVQQLHTGWLCLAVHSLEIVL